MQIAVTDACIFIDLLELKITQHFFQLNLDIHTTYEVWDELRMDQQEILTAYRSVGKLTVHILEPADAKEITGISYPKGLSPPDVTVLYIAEKLDALLLSSDGSVRKFAPNRGIKTHGMFWILDQLVDKKLVEKPHAAILIKKLFEKNIMYKNNSKLWKEAEKRIKTWS